MAEYKTETLTTTLKNGEFDAYRDVINKKLIAIQMLASVQDNLCRDIESILDEHGKYKHEVKMNLKQLHRDISMNIKNDSFFGRMSDAAVDEYMRRYEPLEKLVYDYINNNLG